MCWRRSAGFGFRIEIEKFSCEFYYIPIETPPPLAFETPPPLAFKAESVGGGLL